MPRLGAQRCQEVRQDIQQQRETDQGIGLNCSEACAGEIALACSFRRVLVHIITVKVLKSEEQTRPDLRIAHTVR